MKKAEIIKNGMLDLELIVVNPTESEIEAIKKAFAENNEKWNVNLKPINTKIDWDKIEYDFENYNLNEWSKFGLQSPPKDCFDWLKKRIEKELKLNE